MSEFSAEFTVHLSLLCTYGEPIVMMWTMEGGVFRIHALRRASELIEG